MTPHPAATVLGYPRIGRGRELKRATESYWSGGIDAAALDDAAAAIRRDNWQTLAAAGIIEVPVNDFSYYDHVADTIAMLGAVPPRHRSGTAIERYFAMARGDADSPPLEMTKWFDTNYHCLVPELAPDATFHAVPDKPVNELSEAIAIGLLGRPVLLGPVTFLAIAKPAATAAGFDPLTLLPRLLPVYEEILAALRAAGAEWVQLDEPILATDPAAPMLRTLTEAYQRLCGAADRPKLLLASYFDSVTDGIGVLRTLPLEGVALDLTGPGRRTVAALVDAGGLPGKRLVAGVVDGRNVWANDLADSLAVLESLRPLAAEVVPATSCSLLHVPLDVRRERRTELMEWLAFAEQKLAEISVLARGLADGRDAVADELAARSRQLAARAGSPLAHDSAVAQRLAALSEDDLRRSPRDVRRSAQADAVSLPALPTTTIGSFPQTKQVRAARAAHRAGSLTDADYEARIESEIAHVIRLQESLDIDVLVHGEAERNDMVQYFAERLRGFVTTEHGWVQSFGSRYVRPPILFGDVSRPEPMTVRTATYAQQLTDRPVKGMLTGPVTMLAWSFVRADQPLSTTARQVALALRDEVRDLVSAGIRIVQVDEPALRELLPLHPADRPAYLRWAVDAFRLATAGAPDQTAIHTHMCYAEFGDILPAIEALDADVISLEAARSRMQIADELSNTDIDVGPGVYDIHSPRIPSTDEMAAKIALAAAAIGPGRLWVNPDCGLKTRTEPEVTAALSHMVAAAKRCRESAQLGVQELHGP